METQTQPAARGVALLPLLLFLSLFLGSGVYHQMQGTSFAFYQLSAPVAALPAILLAVLLSREKIATAIDRFIHGAGNPNIIAMCMIYLLAGAFSSVAKATGGVDATVGFALAFIPAKLLLPGIFLVAAFISTAMGTSMGTIAAIAPIALGIADSTGLSLPLVGGTVVGGAMFGDNLSIISDTTIAATRSQGCEMRDKFRVNIFIAVPAAIVTLVFLAFAGTGNVAPEATDTSLVAVIPYLVILVLAVSGVNVFTVLSLGVVLAGIVGVFITPDYSLGTYSKNIWDGFTGMQEIFILSLLIGGLGELMHRGGGIAFLKDAIRKVILKTRKPGAEKTATEFGIAATASLTDIATANNTVAIIVSGGLAKELADDAKVDPKRSAAILDVFSCVFQGLIPYGAQTLLCASILKISPVAITGKIYYCMVLALCGVADILIRSNRKG